MRLVSCTLLSLLLVACASDEPEVGATMTEGMASRLLKPDMKKRSGFESSLRSENSQMGDYFSQQNYGTKEADRKSYRRSDGYKTDTFSGADDRSQIADQTFSGQSQPNRMADQTFAADAARLGDQTARQQTQVFRESGDTFKTTQVRDAAKSQAQNKRPLIVEPDAADLAPEKRYSEDDIRRLLNRN